jgi:glycosyltransferase involved in cell wall biosynthesis
MRIAHFIHRYPPALGGAETYFARLSEALVEAGHQVTVFTTTAHDLSAFWNPRARQVPAGTFWERGVQVRRFPLLHLPAQRWLLRLLSLVPHKGWQAWTMSCSPLPWSMWQEVGRLNGGYDLVHGTALPYTWPLLCARRLARRHNLPFLVTPFVHLGDLDRPRNRIRRAFTRPALLNILRSADRLFVQTEGERQALLDLGFASKTLVLQGMGIRPEEVRGGGREATRRLWGIKPDTVVIGHLANLSKEKGTIDLLQAALPDERLSGKARLVLAGAQMPNFQRFWKKVAHKDRVLLLGPLSESEKRAFFAAIDLFVLPSRVDSFGLVVLEAWANGVPVIVYRAGGLPGVVRDQVDGLVIPCGNQKALANAMVRLVEDDLLRMQFGEAGLSRIHDHWTLERSLAVVRETYDMLLGNRAVAVPERLRSGGV